MGTLADRITALASAIAVQVKSLKSTKANLQGGNSYGGVQTFGGVINASVGVVCGDMTALRVDGSVNLRTHSGFWQYNGATKAKGYPTNETNWIHLISSTHNNEANYFAFQLAATFFQNTDFYMRCTAGDGNTEWRKIWHSGSSEIGNPDTDFVAVYQAELN